MKAPQKKADELVNNMFEVTTDAEFFECIQCAKIAVEEIIKVLEKAADPYSTVMTIEYWQEVLNCLNKM